MKTTIELADELLHRAKQAALARSRSLKEAIASVLVQALGRAPSSQPPLRTVVWPPANSQAAQVSGDDIRRNIRLERDHLVELSINLAKDLKSDPKTKPVPSERKARKANERRQK